MGITTRDQIMLDLKRCYSRQEILDIVRYLDTETRVDEYKHILRAYDLTSRELLKIITDRL